MSYEHRFHAGNVGDVFKHAAWLSLLGEQASSRAVVDTHGGEGAYALASTGEWTEGVGRLLSQVRSTKVDAVPEVVRRYAEVVGPSLEQRHYPGSPRLALDSLGEQDRLIAYELVDGTRDVLARSLQDPRASVRAGDGFVELVGALDEVREASLRLVLIDPPYADRREWPAAAEAFIAATRADPKARVALWYPIKSYARPNAMLAQLERAGVQATALELITSPLTLKKNRLNGSGLIFASPPPGLLERLAAALAWLGPRLSAHGGWWTSRMVGLSGLT